jgi:hypothetical protein
MKMQNPREMTSLIRSLSAVTVFAAVASLGAVAAQAQSPAPAPISPTMNFRAYMAAPVNPAAASASDSSSFSSSSSSTDEAEPSAPSLMGSESAAGQPPPRRRYGRPSYADSHTNADGSPKYTFFGGGGFGLPVGGTHNYLTTGWGIQVGGGRNFNKKFGVALQFDYDHFGFQSGTLSNLLNNVYDPPPISATDQNGNSLSQLGGSTHIWSFTLDPKYNITQGDNWGTYVVGGVGFYHKVADFTTPGLAEECSIYYGCFEYNANQTIDSYVSNAPGFSGGVGVTYKFSRFTSERFFAEARYVYIANQSRPFSLGAFGSSASTAGPNLFPQNSATTAYIPVKFGIRF